MAIYVIGDLHLSFQNPKPMNIFGDNWDNHEEKVRDNWIEKVTGNDVVILAGDFSWAMSLEEAKLDFDFINKLPGKKILLKGNHDYWWTTITKMKEYMYENEFNTINFLFNNSYCIDNCILVGTRGWALNENGIASEKIINRELGRFELSIKDAIKNYGTEKEIVAFMHYPPITKNMSLNENKFINLMNKYGIKKCYYAHLHGKSHLDAVEGIVNGIEFKLISGDYIDFNLEKVK